MTSHRGAIDAIVVGGGFYGAVIAVYLAKVRALRRVVLLEQEPRLMTRASYCNQARVHNGYHYPRSFTTAFRSRVNLPRFVKDWPYAVKKDFTKLYAIARPSSKVTAKQFERFCYEIGAVIKPAEAGLKNFFEARLIESVYLVEEYAFDSTLLAKWAAEELEAAGVEVRYLSRATSLSRGQGGSGLIVGIQSGQKEERFVTCRYVFNCTYSGLNQLRGEFSGTKMILKHEVTELGLVEVPSEIKDLGVTIMDGPFFSVMPFPPRSLHTLSHVRYTPHLSWMDAQGVDPYKIHREYERETRVDRMLRDVSRYMPIMEKAKHVDSLFEVKTVLVKNEGDDGRPILFEKHVALPGCYSVLGGKIDNIYDVLEKLDAEIL